MEQQELRIDISKTVGCICENCSNSTFTERVLLRKISKFIIGAQADAHIPIPVFVCAKCETIHQGSLNPQVKSLFNIPEDEEPQGEGAKIVPMFKPQK